MTDRAYWVLAFTHLLALFLLWRVAPGGELALVGGGLVLALAAIPPPPRRRARRRLRNDLRGLVPLLGPVLAVSVGVAMLLRISLTDDAGTGGLAWFARALCLGGLALLPRTPPAGLVLHALALVLALWTGAALHGPRSPAPSLVVLTALVVGLMAQGILLARSLDLRRAAEGSITTGVAPSPWGIRASRAPAGGIALLVLLPFALGVELPRLTATTASRPAPPFPKPIRLDERPPMVTPPKYAPPRLPDRQVEFTPRLATDLGRGKVLEEETLVARVASRPAVQALYLRGAALTSARARGFFTGQARLPQPRLTRGFRRALALQVELLRRQSDALFVVGRVRSVGGVRPNMTPAGLVAPQAKYPLKYTLTCELRSPSQDLDGLEPLVLPTLLYLPSTVRGDRQLLALAKRIARGDAPHARARSAVAWLHANCTYDLAHPRPTGLDLRGLVRRFLLEERRGICEEFSLALAVVLRLVGVPTRIATGYLAAERDDEGRFLVRARDAHAWVEVALRGAGWVGYDASPPQSTLGSRRRADPGSRERAVVLPPPPSPAKTTDPAPLPRDEEPRPGPVVSSGSWPSWAFPLAVVLIALGGLVGTLLARRRLLEGVRALQLARDPVAVGDLLPDRERLFALLARRGFRLDGPQTPLEFLDQLEAAGPCEPELEQAVGLYTQLRFSGDPDAAASRGLRRALRSLGV